MHTIGNTALAQLDETEDSDDSNKEKAAKIAAVVIDEVTPVPMPVQKSDVQEPPSVPTATNASASSSNSSLGSLGLLDSPRPLPLQGPAESSGSSGSSGLPEIDVSHLITEDDTPVDSVYTEKLERILTEPLYTSWPGPPPRRDGKTRTFSAFANVGLFAVVANPAIVPDVMLSLDVEIPQDLMLKENRSYFIWKYGKFPDVVIEIVSNRVGDELTDKLDKYLELGIRYYVVFDPLKMLGETTLHVFKLDGGRYTPTTAQSFDGTGLGLVEWHGTFERMEALWLRWVTSDGTLLPTGAERAIGAEARAEDARLYAENEKARAENEKARAENEKTRAENEKTRAENEKARAENEKTRAENEKARAENEKARAENEKTRADAAEERARRLEEKLRAMGLDVDGDAK